MTVYTIDDPSLPSNILWHEYNYGYSEYCDVCGKERDCHNLVNAQLHMAIDICTDCLRKCGKVVE